MSIELEPPTTPFHLKIEPLEIDEQCGSFRASIRCCIPHSADSGRFLYEASDIWFSYDDFDRFFDQISTIARGRPGQASLSDSSDYVNLTIAMEEDGGQCTIRIFEPLDVRVQLVATFACGVEFAGMIRDKFREFPRWW